MVTIYLLLILYVTIVLYLRKCCNNGTLKSLIAEEKLRKRHPLEPLFIPRPNETVDEQMKRNYIPSSLSSFHSHYVYVEVNYSRRRYTTSIKYLHHVHGECNRSAENSRRIIISRRLERSLSMERSHMDDIVVDFKTSTTKIIILLRVQQKVIMTPFIEKRA